MQFGALLESNLCKHKPKVTIKVLKSKIIIFSLKDRFGPNVGPANGAHTSPVILGLNAHWKSIPTGRRLLIEAWRFRNNCIQNLYHQSSWKYLLGSIFEDLIPYTRIGQWCSRVSIYFFKVLFIFERILMLKEMQDYPHSFASIVDLFHVFIGRYLTNVFEICSFLLLFHFSNSLLPASKQKKMFYTIRVIKISNIFITLAASILNLNYHSLGWIGTGRWIETTTDKRLFTL